MPSDEKSDIYLADHLDWRVLYWPVLAISEVTRRAKSIAISYLSIFCHVHNKKYEEKSLFSSWMHV